MKTAAAAVVVVVVVVVVLVAAEPVWLLRGFATLQNYHSSKTHLRRLERVFASSGDWFRVNAIPITMPREIERTGNESCKFTINLS